MNVKTCLMPGTQVRSFDANRNLRSHSLWWDVSDGVGMLCTTHSVHVGRDHSLATVISLVCN